MSRLKCIFRIPSSFFAAVLLLSVGYSFAQDYVVKKGDSLSKIAQTYFDGRIYGKQGSLFRLLELNPQLKNHPDLIRIGQTLDLGESSRLAVQPKPLPLVLERTPSSDAVAAPTIEPPQSTQPQPLLGSFSLQINTHSLKIVATDIVTGGKAQLLSKSDIGATLNWSQTWSDHIGSFVFAGIRKSDFITPTTGGLLTPSVTLSHFGLGADLKMSRLNLQFLAGSIQQPFVSGISSSEIVVDAIHNTYSAVQIKLMLAEVNSLRLQLSGGSRIFNSLETSTMTAKGNSSSYGTIEISKRMTDTYGISAGIGYTTSTQNNTTAKQNTTDIGGFVEFIKYVQD